MENTFRIRPAGRHVLTIGRDLIQDKYAAIVELVKNAYDADSKDVVITFKKNLEDTFDIVIEDHGHGMSRDVVINKWMVPSTNDKLQRKLSPNGRVMQGRKGVGRYASSVLGDNLLMETTHDGVTTTVYIDWDLFNKADYLNDVDILIETTPSNLPQGTRLTISNPISDLSEWIDKKNKKVNAIDTLKFELRKLISPVENVLLEDSEGNVDRFKIMLSFENIIDEGFVSEEINPLPIFDLFDYKISGVIEESGDVTLDFYNQKNRVISHERIVFRKEKTLCGRLEFDIRVYDRDKDAIDALIQKGLKNDTGNYLGKMEARRLLDEHNGIGVYRNGFRIRPLGDAEFDWLKLNEDRVQNPSMKIGSNQVIGYVKIQSEEQSNLIEKSARDGLKENGAYSNLKLLTKDVISELEKRRFAYRRKVGLGRTTLKIEQELEKLFNSEVLKKDIRNKLEKSGLNKKHTEEIIDIISKNDTENNKIVDNIRQIIAIYQGQATLGKIINVVLHEGRRPLSYFKNQASNLKYWVGKISHNKGDEVLDKINSLADGFEQNTKVLAELFSKIDPLATAKRGPKRSINLKLALEKTFEIFSSLTDQNSIDVIIECPKEFELYAWSQDIQAVFANLIDNSIYWMISENSPYKKIHIIASVNNNTLDFIDYKDSGPGIDKGSIENDLLFEPEYTTKPSGSGIGLAIAGEAALRNNLKLQVFECDSGAYFRLQHLSEKDV